MFSRCNPRRVLSPLNLYNSTLYSTCCSTKSGLWNLENKNIRVYVPISINSDLYYYQFLYYYPVKNSFYVYIKYTLNTSVCLTFFTSFYLFGLDFVSIYMYLPHLINTIWNLFWFLIFRDFNNLLSKYYVSHKYNIIIVLINISIMCLI